MTPPEAERIINAYGTAIVEGAKEGIARRGSLLPRSTEEIREAFRVYVESLVMIGQLTDEMNRNLGGSYSLLTSFLPDDEARRVNAAWHELQKLSDKNTPEGQRLFQEIDPTRFVGDLTLWGEFDEWVTIFQEREHQHQSVPSLRQGRSADIDSGHAGALEGEAIIPVQRYIVMRVSHLVMACSVPFVWGLVSIFDRGWSTGSLVLVGGALGATLGLFLYGLTILSAAMHPRRSFALMFGTFAGFLPYLYGCYLTFYEGFWGFVRLFTEEFSLLRIVGSIVFLALGAAIVSITHDTNAFHKRLGV